jgi:hypothetical protein
MDASNRHIHNIHVRLLFTRKPIRRDPYADSTPEYIIVKVVVSRWLCLDESSNHKSVAMSRSACRSWKLLFCLRFTSHPPILSGTKLSTLNPNHKQICPLGIAGAITLTLNLVEALDSRNGSAGDYREAVAFLQVLKRVLESLRTLPAWNSYPAYGKDIREQVEQIRGPIERFLDEIRKYEPSLGSKAPEGRHRQFVGKVHVKEGAEFEEDDRVQFANSRFNNPAPDIVSNLLILKPGCLFGRPAYI